MNRMKITAKHLKHAVMHYYRFKRQFVCADEVRLGWGDCDILVDTGKEFIEVECKVSKNDLTRLEATKKKYRYKTPDKYKPNKFFLCVPPELQEIAEEWIHEKDDRFGLLIYIPNVTRFKGNRIKVVKKAKKLHDRYREDLKLRIIKRLSSSRINTLESSIK